MIISWFGLSSFKITGHDVTIITDPFGSKTGLAPVKGTADIILSSNSESEWCNNFSSISGDPFIISGPGEFDIKGAFIIGTPAENKDLGPTTIFAIEVEDIRIAFLGPIQQNQLSDTQQEILEGSDIVLVPVGDKQVLDYEQAARIATQLEPFIVIPHTYKIPKLTANLDKIDKFVKEMSNKSEELEKLTLKKKDLTSGSTRLIVLTPMR
ncbi:MAG: MBL fold metallo-hydrolase [bacterium]|nr:MBL fold metallo-hydrolase [bacterium]